MSKKQNPKSTPRLTAEDHRRKRTQILFAIMAVILIISWIASMIVAL